MVELFASQGPKTWGIFPICCQCGEALARHMGADDLANFGETTDLGLPPVKTIEQGAATSVLMAASPDVEGVSGRYYEDCAEAAVIAERGTHTGGVAPYALDPSNADRLWHISVDLTN
jgi:hypothetical protein